MKPIPLDSRTDHERLPLRRRFAYGMSGFAETIVSDTINLWLLLYYNAILGVDAVLVGWALFIPRLYDAITDPLMGQISDNFRSRWGRRRPFIALGGPLWALFFFMLWMVPEGYGSEGKFYYLLAVAFGLYTMQTITLVPLNALGAEISTDYDDRTRVFSTKVFCAKASGFLAPGIWWLAHHSFATPINGFRAIGLVLAAAVAGVLLVVVLGTREDAEAQARPKMRLLPAFGHAARNGPFLLLIFLLLLLIVGAFAAFPFANYINIYHVYGGDKDAAGLVMTIGGVAHNLAQFLCIPLYGWLGIRFGKKKALLISLLGIALAPLTSWALFTPASPWLQIIFQVLLGMAIPGVLIFPSAMIADIVDFDELLTGRRREGVYMATFAFVLKLGFSGTTLFTSYCLRWVGFDAVATVQRPGTLTSLRLILALTPTIIVGIAALLLLLYPIEEQNVRANRQVLDERRKQHTRVVST